MRCVGWCGLCYSNVKGRGNNRGHAQFRSRNANPTGWRKWCYMKKPDQGQSPAVAAKAERCKLTSSWTALWEQLTDVAWDDGSERRPSTLLLFFSDGVWKACLNDKESERTGWIAGHTLSELLSSLDKALAGNKVDWRAAKAYDARKQKK